MIQTRPASTCDLATESSGFNAFVATVPPTFARGPLSGVRLAVKDMIECRLRRPAYGLDQQTADLPDEDAPVLQRLLAAGAGIVGFAAMSALASEPTGLSGIRPFPQNPWNERRIPGGSSSGSAVAVAAGLADLALGSDTGGSVRIPAHCCGVVGYKPTFGLLPTAGCMPLAPSLDTIGFLARDAGLIQRALGALNIAAFGAMPARVAVAADLTLRASEASGAASKLVVAITRQLGAGVVERRIGDTLGALDAPVLTVLSAESAVTLEKYRNDPGLEPALALRLAKGAAVDPDALAKARADIATIALTHEKVLFGDAQVLIMPVMPVDTPEIATCTPGEPSFSARGLYALSAYTRFVNALGLPAIALPATLDRSGMPVAIQLVGRAGSDACLLTFAAALQQRLGRTAFIPPTMRTPS
ncbi:MAG: amidase [Alphaproteobacteria bacterium]